MSAVSKPLVSVVTPVYNGAAHLAECIESVLAQTYPNWDYAIVNNCSTDETLEVAGRYASRDSRIRVHSNDQFLDVNGSYNSALRRASTDCGYCKVIAADDLLFPDCLDKMVQLGEQHPRVGIIGAYQLHGTEVLWQGLSHENAALGGREACRIALMGGPDLFGTPTSLMFRADLVRSRHGFYDESTLHADTEVCYDFLQNWDFGFVHQVLTFGRVRESSVTSFSQRFNTYLPGRLRILIQFGPRYLSEAEQRVRIKSVLNEYYGYLARQVFRGRDKDFWDYHSNELAKVGHPLSRARLWGEVTSVTLDHLLNPKSSFEKALHRLRTPNGDQHQ